MNPAVDTYFGTDGVIAKNSPGDSVGPVYNSDGKIISVNAFRILPKIFDNNYHTSLTENIIDRWIQSILATEAELFFARNIGGLLADELTVELNSMCLYIETKTQPWLNSSFSKCPINSDNRDFYNYFFVVDYYSFREK